MAITTSQITITTMEGWYSGVTPPLNPLIGDLWLDTTRNEIKKYDGTNWIKQADTQGPQGPKGDSMVSSVAYWIKSSTKPEPPDSETGDMKGWTKGSEPPESALAGILPSDKFWRIYKETYSNGENEYSKYSEVELIGSYEVLNGLVQFRKGVTTTENIDGQDVTVIDGGKIKTGSIDAKKIYVEDLETLNATIGGFHIGKNSIYSGNKKIIDSTERGIYFDSNGQSYFGDDKNFIRFYRSDKDNYKLQISADSLTFGSGVSVEKAFEDIKGDVQNAQDSVANVKDQIVSMGEQLVINGNGLMGDNTNFSALIFDASKANGSPGSFTREGTSCTTPSSDTYIPINPNLRYSFEMDVISKNGLIRMYSFLDFYDVDKKSIGSDSHMYIENTLTHLTRDLKNGDTVVHFNDLSGWNDTFTQNYRRGFIFWNYTNSFGYTYPELTYSRNSWGNLYENSNVDKTNNTITLNAPWSHGTFKAGTKLSQCNSGGTYKYQGMSYTKVPTKWTHYSGFYDGTDYSGKNVQTKFPPGTAYAKVGFLWNYNKLDDQCWVTNISLKTDYDNAIKNAQTTADNAQTTADNAQTTADNALKSTKENAAQMAQMVTDFNVDIKNLQDQIDGNITTWFYDVDPDMSLPPVTDWDTDEKKDAHLGDIYYNTVKGYAWRFMKSGSTYSWERITDTDVTKALADAAKAQDTANSKRRVFYNTPTVPYDAGDLWVQGSGGDILRCAQAKTNTGSYNRNDWILASKYTDDSALTTWIKGDFATTIQGLEEGLVDAKIETYYQTTDPSTEWPTDKKMEHKGDLWYNSTPSVQKYYRWSGTAWQELTATPPKEVFDSIDNKATIYTGTTPPSSPSQGDLWFKGANDPILTYVGNTWVEYNKYTDNTRAEEAYDKAGEAAKTADNYISADSTGIMVSENKGATKETPSNATKNNVLITDTDVQIRNGQKTVASYGETSTIGDTAGKNMRVSGYGVEIRDGDKVRATYGSSEIVLGDLSGDNILLEANRMAIRAGASEKMAIESTKTTTIVTENHFFDGARVSDELASGGISMNRWTLNNPVDIKKVRIRTDSGKMVGSGTYSWSIYGSATLQIVISGDSQEAMDVDWTEYTTMEVTYESGSVVSNAKCDKFEAKDNAGKFVSFTETISGTGTATADTGSVSIQPKWWRCGNLVQMEFRVATTGAVNPGKNLATGTIKGIPRPVTTYGLRAVSYYGNNANVLFVSQDGAFTVRNCGSDALAKGNDAIGVFTYITDGTML